MHQQSVNNFINYFNADGNEQKAYGDPIVGKFGPPGFQMGEISQNGMISQTRMNKMVSQSIQQVNYVQTAEVEGVQCSYNIKEGQQVLGKTSYYQEAASKTFKTGAQSRPGAAVTESPEGVLDSALPKAAVTDVIAQAMEMEPQADDQQPKKTTGRKRRQRRRKHKNKNKDKEGEGEAEDDQFLDENFDENDEDFQQIYVADNAAD